MIDGVEIWYNGNEREIVAKIDKVFEKEIEKMSQMYNYISCYHIIKRALEREFDKVYVYIGAEGNAHIYEDGDVNEVIERARKSIEREMEKYHGYYEHLKAISKEIEKGISNKPNTIQYYPAWINNNWIKMEMQLFYFRNVYVTKHVHKKAHIILRIQIGYNIEDGRFRIENSIYKRAYDKKGEIRKEIIDRFNKLIKEKQEIDYNYLLGMYAEDYYKKKLNDNIERAIGKILKKYGIEFETLWGSYNNKTRRAIVRIVFKKDNIQFCVMDVEYKPKSFKIDSIKFYNKKIKVPRELYIRLYRYF